VERRGTRQGNRLIAPRRLGGPESGYLSLSALSYTFVLFCDRSSIFSLGFFIRYIKHPMNRAVRRESFDHVAMDIGEIVNEPIPFQPYAVMVHVHSRSLRRSVVVTAKPSNQSLDQ